jgi:hypothetical protein
MQTTISASKIFDCEDISLFIDSIVQVLPFKGYSNARFYLCEINSVRFLTKLCFYRKSPPELYGSIPEGIMAHTDAEIGILWTLKERIIDANISPCILEIVYSHICESLRKITPSRKFCERYVHDGDMDPRDGVSLWLCKYKEYVDSGLAHDKCAFVVLEQCDMTLDQFLIKYINVPIYFSIFKSLLFMIIHAFRSIKRVFPGFHHFDFHTENLMLKFNHAYQFRAGEPKFLVFHVDGNKYSPPYFGIIPKIIDFGFSSLPEAGFISSATKDRITMFERSENDLLFLFHWIYRTSIGYNRDRDGLIENLLSTLDPTKSFINYDTEYIRKIRDKIPTYDDMLSNKVFDEYKNMHIVKSQIYEEYSDV